MECVLSSEDEEFEADRTVEIDGLHFQLRKVRTRHVLFLKGVPEEAWLVVVPQFCARVFDFEKKWIFMSTEVVLNLPAPTLKKLTDEIAKQF